MRPVPFALLALLGFAPTALPQAVVVPPSARTSLGLTVYDGFAVLRESRALAEGSARSILWLEVPASIDPGTVVLSGDDGPIVVLRQTWEAPLAVATALRSAVGAPVTLVGPDGSRIEARLESAEGPTFRVGDRILVDWPGAIELPATSDATPGGALRWELDTATAGPLTAAYLAEGLGWSADYTAVLGEEALVLDGYVNVQNQTGIGFTDVRLDLVAGQVRRASSYVPAAPPVALRMAEAAADEGVSQGPLGDVHLYSVDEPVTLAPLGSTRLSLFHAERVPMRREYVLSGQPWWFQSRVGDLSPSEHPEIRIRFTNRGIAGADAPLPGGVLHTWRADDRGRLQFSGEALLPHTASEEEVAATIGAAFDLVAERVQTDFRQIDPRTYESAWRVEIRNRSRSSATVLVVERMPGPEWTIVEENLAHERVSTQVTRWAVRVPAGGTTTLTYRVRVSQN